MVFKFYPQINKLTLLPESKRLIEAKIKKQNGIYIIKGAGAVPKLAPPEPPNGRGPHKKGAP